MNYSIVSEVIATFKKANQNSKSKGKDAALIGFKAI